MNLPASIEVTLRRPAKIEVHAPLARVLLAGGKRRGMRRLPNKVARTLFYLVHQRLGWPAAAVLIPTGGAVPFVVDCANTGFLDYARHSRPREGFEPEVCGLFSYLAPRLAIVYDIGANWGLYPLLFGTHPCFQGEVHAFEIRPQTAAHLRHVVTSSGLGERVLVHAHGLSDYEGMATLEITRHSYLARIVDEAHSGATELVEVRRLDEIGLPPPQLIKLDVEGHEAAVLRGGEALLRRHRPLIVFENWHQPDRPEVMLEPLRFLEALGYQFARIEWQLQKTNSVAEQRGIVALRPLAPDERPGIAGTLNLLAYQSEHVAVFFRDQALD
jgi:FkbM family methyltransferase